MQWEIAKTPNAAASVSLTLQIFMFMAAIFCRSGLVRGRGLPGNYSAESVVSLKYSRGTGIVGHIARAIRKAEALSEEMEGREGGETGLVTVQGMRKKKTQQRLLVKLWEGGT